jgi:hypothetical protein
VLWLTLLGLAATGVRSLAANAPEPRRFEVTASRYQFVPARIEVRQGDVVELVLRSLDTDHGMAIKAYGVKVAIPKGGESVGVSFLASRPGPSFECSSIAVGTQADGWSSWWRRRSEGGILVAGWTPSRVNPRRGGRRIWPWLFGTAQVATAVALMLPPTTRTSTSTGRSPISRS